MNRANGVAVQQSIMVFVYLHFNFYYLKFIPFQSKFTILFEETTVMMQIMVLLIYQYEQLTIQSDLGLASVNTKFTFQTHFMSPLPIPTWKPVKGP